MDDHNLVQGFFQQLYDDISEKTNLCALKGSFVIDNIIDDIDNVTRVNLINKLHKISSKLSSRKNLKSHTLFMNCKNYKNIEIKEIEFTQPLTFTCTVNGQTYEMQFKICKYYSFSTYFFLKFERYETISGEHLISAIKTYPLNQPREKTVKNGDENIDEKYLFYHAENRQFEAKKHMDLVRKVFFPNITFLHYLITKNNYNKCADFRKIKDCDCSSNGEKNCLSNCEEKCLSNDIYIPYEYIQNYFNNKKLEGGKNKKGRKSRKNRRKNRKIKKSRKYRKSRKL